MHGVSAPPASVPVNSNRRLRKTTQIQTKISIQGQQGGEGGGGCCHCGRRGLLLGALLPLPLQLQLQLQQPLSVSAAPPTDPTAAVEMLHPSRPDFYKEMYATAMATGMKAYETEVSGYKQKLFSNLMTGTANNVLELGVGTGPNFKYYANNPALTITGVDPNKQMEKYARSSAANAGLPLSNFNFIRGVGEALPVDDESMDVIIGTLVLCSVKDVDATLRDGTFLRFVQGALDPLQQVVADGCHLTRETGKQIAGVGFSRLSLNNTFLKSVSFLGPHVYGVACK